MLISTAIPVLLSLISSADATLGPIVFSDPKSVNSTLSALSENVMTYYDADRGETGVFNYPYDWGHSGMAWNTLIEYWSDTNDTQYQNLTRDALQHHRGNNSDIIMPAFVSGTNNERQGFWAMTMLTASERGFPETDKISWLNVSENAFAVLATRWAPDSCGGGMGWWSENRQLGYNFKDSATNGNFFNLAARLYRATGNSSYLDWSETVWDWSEESGLIKNGSVYDGVDAQGECQVTTTNQYSSPSGAYIAGCAVLYEQTKDSKWLDRATTVWEASKKEFFTNKIMYEPACFPQREFRCNLFYRLYKAMYAAHLGEAASVPELSEIREYLSASARAAVDTCTVNDTCTPDWVNGKVTEYHDMSEEAAVLAVVLQAARVGNQTEADDKAASERESASVSSSATATKATSSPSATGVKNSGSVVSASMILVAALLLL